MCRFGRYRLIIGHVWALRGPALSTDRAAAASAESTAQVTTAERDLDIWLPEQLELEQIELLAAMTAAAVNQRKATCAKRCVQ